MADGDWDAQVQVSYEDVNNTGSFTQTLVVNFFTLCEIDDDDVKYTKK